MAAAGCNTATCADLPASDALSAALHVKSFYFSTSTLGLNTNPVIRRCRVFWCCRVFKEIDTGCMKRGESYETGPPAVMMNPLAQGLLRVFRFGPGREFGAEFSAKLLKPKSGLCCPHKLCEFLQRGRVDQRQRVGCFCSRASRFCKMLQRGISSGGSFHLFGVLRAL